MFRIFTPLSKTNLITLIICVLSLFSTAFSQQKNTVIEDDYETLQGKIRLYFNSSVDRSMMYAQQMAKSTNYKHLAFANSAMTVFFQAKGNIKESQKRYKAAIFYLEKMPESRDKVQMKSYVYNYGAITESNRGNYSKALENYHIALKYADQIHDIKQLVKIRGNIAVLNEAVGNYKLSIKNLKYLINFINENKDIFTKTELLNHKSNFNRGLGSAYESYFMKNLSKRYLLDSTEHYYKKTVFYSQNFLENKIVAKLSLGNVYNWKYDFKNAEKTYLDVVFLAQKNNQISTLSIANYNLADVYYSSKQYDKALIFYKKSDSIAEISGNPLNTIDYLKSNFYQAKIYTILNKPDLAYKHSKIYLENYEKYEAKLSEEALEVNYKQGVKDLTAEMLSMEKKYEEKLFLRRVLYVFYILLFIGVLFFVIKSRILKSKAEKEISSLVEKSTVKKLHTELTEIAN